MKEFPSGFDPEYHEYSVSLAQIEELTGYAVLEFGTPWCGHCKASTAAVQETLSKRQLPHIKVLDGKGQRLGRSFKVKLWPTLILLDDGSEVARLVRPTSAEQVEDFLSLTPALG